MKLAGFALRATVGGLFVGHGLQKLTGAFDGPGLEGTEKMVESMGMLPARRNALAVALAETLGGVGIVTGTATPLAAGALIATMLTAIRKVHWKNGLWNSKHGYEFNAVLIAALLALTEAGPGRASLDAAFGRRRWGTGGAMFALALGIGGTVAATELARREGQAGAGVGATGAGAAGPDAAESDVMDSGVADSSAADSGAADSSAADDEMPPETA